jgi:Tfp pilus assembly protein PilX
MEANRMMQLRSRQQGVALPVMLIILVVMLAGSIYMFRSSNSSTLTSSNLAYDMSMSKAADFGLHAGFEFLAVTAESDKIALNQDDAENGYRATFDTTLSPNSDAFWNGSTTVTDEHDNTIEYVIHRLCKLSGPYDSSAPLNTCVQTSANTSTLNNAVALGDSLASDASSFAGSPQLHYVITARIFGARGGNVVNQTVVMIGA